MKAHEHKKEHGAHHKHAAGGKVEEMKMKEPEGEEHKKGGRVKRKRGGSVPGHHGAARLDKISRSGGKSPLSGADAPNMGYAQGAAPTKDEGGKGKKPG